jgi:hypothetical protein
MGANAIDLTDVAAVNDILMQGATTDSAKIQGMITAYSQNILTRTGRRNLSKILSFNETYSGTGSDVQQLRNYPILAVSSLIVGTQPVPASPGPTQAGYVIDQSGSENALAIIGGGPIGNWSAGETPWRGGGWGGGNAPPLGQSLYRFVEGRMNVQVAYTAGYALDQLAESQSVPVDSIPGAVTSGSFVDGETITQGTTSATATLLESTNSLLSIATVSGSPDGSHAWTGSTSGAVFTPTGSPTAGPYTVAVDEAADFWQDLGVTLSDGTPLEAVSGTPGSGQYNAPAFGVAPLGVYTFNAAQAGAQLNLSYQYGGTPYDLAEAAGRLVAVQYRRRGWLGQTSQMQPGIGTTAYSRLETELDTKAVIERYKARFIPS